MIKKQGVKKMSNVSKGQYSVAICKEYCEKKGYEFDTVEKPRNKFQSGGHKDLFGLFDAIAIKSENYPLWIQVKTNNPGNVLKYKEFSSLQPYVIVWIFTSHRTAGKRKGIVIHEFFKGHLTKIDLRGSKPKSAVKKLLIKKKNN